MAGCRTCQEGTFPSPAKGLEPLSSTQLLLGGTLGSLGAGAPSPEHSFPAGLQGDFSSPTFSAQPSRCPSACSLGPIPLPPLIPLAGVQAGRRTRSWVAPRVGIPSGARSCSPAAPSGCHRNPPPRSPQPPGPGTIRNRRPEMVLTAPARGAASAALCLLPVPALRSSPQLGAARQAPGDSVPSCGAPPSLSCSPEGGQQQRAPADLGTGSPAAVPTETASQGRQRQQGAGEPLGMEQVLPLLLVLLGLSCRQNQPCLGQQ